MSDDSITFSLDKRFLKQFEGKQPKWGPLGYVTYKRTYARNLPGGGMEEYWQTCKRCIEGTFTIQKRHMIKNQLPWNDAKAQEDAQTMFQLMWEFKFTPPGRGLWMMGSDYVYTRGGACLNNCAFVSTADFKNDFAEPFVFLMDMSMLGVGVGGDAKGAGTITIQEPKLTDTTFIVEDTREGWVELIRTCLNAYTGKNPLPKAVDYSKVRPFGEPISGFGGVASGPEPLNELYEDIQTLLNKRIGQPITSSDIVDIFNLIGRCVVAGNVRRTAEIMFGSPDDKEFMDLKNPELHKKELMHHRWASNNSIFADVGMDYTDVANRTAKNGEPGYEWLRNAQRYGRMIDPPNNKDHRAKGGNPCFAPDTLIAVADGRSAVPIKELAEKGDDVPVYCVDDRGKVHIKHGRRPRKTREHAKLLKITLEDGTSLQVTPDHTMILRDGSMKEAKDLEIGDSLPRFTKRVEKIKKGGPGYYRVVTDVTNPKEAVFEHRLIAKFNEPEKWASMYNNAKEHGWIKGGVVVHHKNYNPLDNTPANLELMSFRDHTKLHGNADNAGSKNPMWGKKHTLAAREKIGNKTVDRCKNDAFRKKLSASHTQREREQASMGLSHQRHEVNKKYYLEQDAKTDLDTVWFGDQMFARKCCIICRTEFIVSWGQREQCCCSRSCANKIEEGKSRRKAGLRSFFASKQEQTLHEQVQIFKNLQEKLGGDPLKKDWENACRTQEVPFRIRHDRDKEINPHILTSYDDLKQIASSYNHRVVSIEDVEGEHDVYNLTVDDHHTVGIVTSIHENGRMSGIFASQCLEQTLEPYELCCLVETYPSMHETPEEWIQTLRYAFMYAKTVTLVMTHNPRTNTVMARNRRIGASMTGIIQAFNKFGRREMLEAADAGYKKIQEWDEEFSEHFAVPKSIKTTSIKPSGTVSLLPGVTPGIHYPIAEYYIRNVRFQEGSPLLDLLRQAGYPIEKDKYSPKTYVVSFPIKERHFDRSVQDVSMWEQLENAAQVQALWADNQVSVTISFSKKEAANIKYALELYETRLKGVSLLPKTDHGYEQAPYIPITKEEYEALSAKVTPLTMNGEEMHEVTDKFCDGEACEIQPTRS